MTTPTPPPADPLVAAAAVAEQLSMPADDPAVLAKLALTVAAVNSLVPTFAKVVPQAAPDGLSSSWRNEHRLGALMLAARLYRRRNSPEGVASFTAEGAVYVQRNDPDVAMLLGLGAYAPPVVG